MKQCPVCQRVYADETLNFCLVDGEWLDGAESDIEPPTAIIVPSALPTEALTRIDDKHASDPRVDSPTNEIRKTRTSRPLMKQGWVLPIVAIGVLVFAGSFGYRYFWSSAAAGPINSVAVLPFENASSDATAEYISDGITESLINSLSQMPNIKVIARSSVFRYKGSASDLATIANDLNVQAVMTGRVLERGDKIDISVELTDVKNNTQLWGQRYTRNASDIFSIQDEIAHQVTDAMRVRLTGIQQEQITKRYTASADAYKLYLQGRYLFNGFSEENLTHSIELYDQAIALDPNYALAYAGRGEAYLQSADLNLPMSVAMSKARQDSTTALKIDDKLVEARTVQAEVRFQFDWDFPGAEEDFKTAITLNPNYAEAHHQYAWYLAMLGRESEAIAEMKLSQQLDPVNPSINVDTCLPYVFQRQFDQCIAESKKTLGMFPQFYIAHMTLGRSLVNKGDYAAGIEELQKARTLESTPHLIGTLGYSYARSGNKEEARKLLAELEELSKHRYVASFWIAMIYAGLDEKDEAFIWLEKAFQERSWWLLFIKMDPMLDPLRSDPRYADLVRRIGFPD